MRVKLALEHANTAVQMDNSSDLNMVDRKLV